MEMVDIVGEDDKVVGKITKRASLGAHSAMKLYPLLLHQRWPATRSSDRLYRSGVWRWPESNRRLKKHYLQKFS